MVDVSMLSSSARASAGSRTGVCLDVTDVPRPAHRHAGLTGTTWPVTSQSNRWPDRGEPLLDVRRRELARAGLEANCQPDVG